MRMFAFCVSLGAVIVASGCAEFRNPPQVQSELPADRGLVGIRARQPVSSLNDKSNLVIDGMPGPSALGGHGVGGPEGIGGGGRPLEPVTLIPQIQKVRLEEPDLEVVGSYSAPGIGKVEVEGVCTFADGPVKCWDVKGARLVDLEQRVAEAIELRKSMQPFQVPTANVAIGWKNRLVVVKTTPQSVDTAQRISVLFAGKHQQGFGLGMSQAARVEGPPASYRLMGASEAPDSTETSLRINQTEDIPGSIELSLQVGATASLGRITFKVASITKTELGGSSPAGPRSSWRVRVVRSPATESIQINLASEGPFGTALPTSPNMDKNDESFTCILQVDPVSLDHITLSAHRVKVIEITGIPLDPKR